ncbi:MAG: ABC transporter permease [Anaerolineae bacterium]|nr:ABC transporter permease [Anaerolineae bacterium]
MKAHGTRTSNDSYGQTPFRHLPLYLLSLGLVLLVWQMGAQWIGDTPRRFLLPTAGEVLARFVKLATDGTLVHHASVTLLEMGLGLLVGTTLAVLLGYGVAHSRLLAYLLEPVIVTSQAVPIVALAPLLTVWFGPKLASKVVVCALIVFFPILVNIVGGLKGIDPRLRDLFRMLEAPRYKVLLHLEIPAALPAFLAGLRVSGTLAGMGAVVGEFVASTQGLGYLVKQGQNLYDMPMMFVAIITLMAIALTVYGLLTVVERRALRWNVQDTTTTYGEETLDA